MIELTPPGRGQIVSHNLYPREELDEVRARVSGLDSVAGGVQSRGHVASEAPKRPSEPPPRGDAEIAELRAEIAELRRRVQDLEEKLDSRRS